MLKNQNNLITLTKNVVEMWSIISNACGVFVADDRGSIMHHYEFKRDAEHVARIYLALKMGIPNSDLEDIIGKITQELKNNTSGSEIIEIEDDFLNQVITSKIESRSFVVKTTAAGRAFRSDFNGFMAAAGIHWTLEDFLSFNRTVNIELTRLQIKSVSEQNDRLIIQAVNSIDDMNRSTNIFSERIREWYGFHFPELTDQLIADHEFFLEIITGIGTRGEFSAEKIKNLRPVQEKIVETIIKRAKESMGGEFSPFDIKTVQAFASSVLDLYKARVKIENYVESLMEQTCPNISAIVGPLLGARLLCLAGGLEALAKKPSSTIQVLGAEKALFRAIKTKSEPPKHGILFQAKEVRSAPFWHRGKIARLLAGKISIAARVDQISKRYIADEMLVDIAKKIAEIQRKYPDKPAQVKERPFAGKQDELQRRPRAPGPQRDRGQGGFKPRQANTERPRPYKQAGGSRGGASGGQYRPHKQGSGQKSFRQDGSGKPPYKKYPSSPKGKSKQRRE